MTRYFCLWYSGANIDFYVNIRIVWEIIFFLKLFNDELIFFLNSFEWRVSHFVQPNDKLSANPILWVPAYIKSILRAMFGVVLNFIVFENDKP